MASTYSAGNAEVYEQLMGRWSRRLAKTFVRFAALGEPERVLDVGCGTGSLALALANAFARTKVVGIDTSAAFIAYARRQTNDPRITFEQADATALPFSDAQFSTALSLLVLNFVPDCEAAAREMTRVTKPGGIVAASVWDFPGGFPSVRMLLDTAAALDSEGATLRAKILFAPLTGPGELAELWERIGLRDVEPSSLTIRMQFRSFADYWEPFLGGQGSMGPYVAGLDEERRSRLVHHLRLAYLAGREDGPRSFAATAWAVRGVR